MYDNVLSVAFGRTGFDAYFLTVELYSGFNCITYDPSGSVVTSSALNDVFVFFIIEFSNSSVFVLDSVPEALINSSIFNGLPAEYRADSILAVASSIFSILVNFSSLLYFVQFVNSSLIKIILILSSTCSRSTFWSLAKNNVAKKHLIEST